MESSLPVVFVNGVEDSACPSPGVGDPDRDVGFVSITAPSLLSLQPIISVMLCSWLV